MYIDIFLIVLLAWAIFNGWRNGFIKELFNMLGTILGLLAACGCYYTLAEYLTVDGTKTNMVLSIIAFFILCFFIPLGLGFAANRVTWLVKEMKLGRPNSLLGAAVSTLKFLLVISFAFNIMENLHIMNDERTATSHLYTPVRQCLNFVRDEARVQLRRQMEMRVERPDTTYIHFDHKADSLPAVPQDNTNE